MASAVAAAGAVAGRLGQLVWDEATLLWRFKDDVDGLKETVELLNAMMRDAYRRSDQDQREIMGVWMKKFKSGAYDAEVLLDKFEDIELMKHSKSKFKLFFSSYNPLWVRWTMGHKIKKVNDYLHTIEEEGHILHLEPENIPIEAQGSANQEFSWTSRSINKGMVGREIEKENIMKLLLESDSEEHISIIPIVGLGGLGKTTLAHAVFSDERTIIFDAKVWVYVSRKFDLARIGEKIISHVSLTGRGISGRIYPPNGDLCIIEEQLKNILHNRRYLIVLDDVWEEGPDNLENLKCMLQYGAKGSKIILTTRNQRVVDIMEVDILANQGKIRPVCKRDQISLTFLSPNDCWNVMRQYAFREGDDLGGLEEIGRQIAEKCYGLPLLAGSLGCLMSLNKSRQAWEEIRDREIILDLEEDPRILQSLMLSYNYMPFAIKLCFTYCAYFLKGFSIAVEHLIQQWKALGYIRPNDDGHNCINYLLGMSFLHISESSQNASAVLKDAMLVSSDDMMYDFARYVLGDGLIVVDGRNGGATVSHDAKRSSNAYLAVISNWDANQRLDLSSILPARILALRFEDCPAKMELSDGAFVFSSAKHLLVLDLSGCSLKKLPESIGQLKRLRYLSAPRIQDRVLPVCLTRLHWLGYLSLHGSTLLSDLTEAFGRLYLLLHLDLSGCSGLKALPDSFGRLRRLEHLDLSGCSGLKALPHSFGRLRRLEHLDLSGCSGLKAPPAFGRLRRLEYLDLSGCSGLKALPHSFGRLGWLQHLDLSGCSGLKALPDSFGRLHWLQHLDLSGCSGLKALPHGRPSYRLEHLDLSGCSGLKSLPYSFGRSSELRHLDLSGWSCVGGITEALSVCPTTFLRYLNLSHRCGYSSVEDWFHLKDLDKVLPKHKELWFLGLSSCLNPLCYTSTPDKSKDYLDRCIRDLVKLQHLDLSHNKFLVQLPESMGNLKELRSLDLSGCIRLKSLPESIGGLKEMCTLNLSGCFRLDRLPERIGELKKLETLDLSGCTQFGPLPENVQQKLAKLRTQGSLTIITNHKVYHPCQAGAHEDQSRERRIVAGDDQAQGSASTPQDASFVDPSSAAEPEIIEATDPDQ